MLEARPPGILATDELRLGIPSKKERCRTARLSSKEDGKLSK